MVILEFSVQDSVSCDSMAILKISCIQYRHAAGTINIRLAVPAVSSRKPKSKPIRNPNLNPDRNPNPNPIHIPHRNPYTAVRTLRVIVTE